MATAEGRKQNGLTSLLQVLVPWVQRTLVEQYGADWVRNPGISAALGARGFSSPVDADKYIRSQTLQAIMVLWNPVFSRVLQPSDLDLIRQLHAAERAHFDDARVDALLDGMATLVTHAGMPNEAARFQRLKKDAGLSGLSKVEGAAMIGGILAAGYLLYEGARSLMQSDDQDDSNDNNINNNNNNNMNNNNNINNNNNDNNINNNSNDTSINNVRNIDNINNNPSVNTTVNNSGNVDINNENINNNNNNENVNINNNNNTENSVADEDAESPFVCPITLQIMKDPVITPQGICFERQAIVDWIEKAHTCPITQKPLAVDQLITCYALRAAIEEYQKLRNSKGVVSPQINNGSAQQPVPAPVPSSSSSNPVSRVQRAVHHAVADRPHINVDVAPRFRGQVKCLTAAQLRSEDTFTHYPEASKYITFPASTNFLVSRSTGYVVIENRGNFEVTLISRQREGNLWEPGNEGGRLCGSYSLGPHQEQGFDYRGWYCIEVPPDLNNRPIDLLVTDFSLKGGGKGAWLRMGTGGPEFKE